MNPDPSTSTLDLLPADRRDRYRNFAWQRLDYPGHAEGEEAGPNEGRATQMTRELAALQSERRPNSGDTAVITQSEFTARMRTYVGSLLRAVPAIPAVDGQPAPPSQAGHQLNETALAEFVRMRTDAHDGVELVIVSSYRSPETSQSRAAGQNPNAIANYSSHNLGLAVDLRMSAGAQRYQETTTRPMQNVIDMRQSPAHKWMFLHGPQYGWYPWHMEPWHWEYNPPGFHDTFQAALEI